MRLGTHVCVRSHVYSYLCPGSDVAAEVCSASGAPACVPLRLPKNAGALRSSWVSYVVGCACSTCFNIAWLAILWHVESVYSISHATLQAMYRCTRQHRAQCTLNVSCPCHHFQASTSDRQYANQTHTHPCALSFFSRAPYCFFWLPGHIQAAMTSRERSATRMCEAHCENAFTSDAPLTCCSWSYFPLPMVQDFSACQAK